ncbi:MAG: hypothetical protein C5B59_10025 [Bacteroidetes bacterium]|nr:MAG: hypothetical protein C5B59_10025 [Bacteroidota bacterium]
MSFAINWSCLLIYLSIIVLIYYLAVVSLFFRTEATASIRNLQKRTKDSAMPMEAGEQYSGNLFFSSSRLASAIEIKIREAAVKKIVREELFYSLQQILKNYSELHNTPFQNAINNLIENNCEKECSIHLSAVELAGLWKG